uniref:mRNA decay activator protein ZFP36 n=1 Tax=Cricetomys gambianus TaxID=10085 RepID=A0A0U2Z2H4_CRIGA|nr:ZFP36L3 [Cricetomys gambianus]
MANHNLNGSSNSKAPQNCSLAPRFIPPPRSRNPQVVDHRNPGASNTTCGPSSGPREANCRGNGQQGATGAGSRAVRQQPRGATAAQRSHPEKGQHSHQRQPKASSSGSQATSVRYKTELCRPFEESGVCRYGNKCQFAHGYRELRTLSRHPKYKTEPCRTFHSVGYCPYGSRCHFIHNQNAPLLVPSESASGEQGSFNGSDAPGLGSNGDPRPRLQSASFSGRLAGHSQPQEAPLPLNHQELSPGTMLPLRPQAASTPTPESSLVASSAATVFYGAAELRFRCATCANSVFDVDQELGGFMAPAVFPTNNFAAIPTNIAAIPLNATAAYYQVQQQQQGLAASGQFPMPVVAPPPRATILAPGASAVAPGAGAAGPSLPSLVAPIAATAADDATSAATITEDIAAAAEGPAPNLQLPEIESDSPEFDVISSTLDSLLNIDDFDDFLSCSSASSLDGRESPSNKPHRLPIFSRLSDSDK